MASGLLADVKRFAGRRPLGAQFPHAFPLQLDAVGVVDQAVQDGVGQGRVADQLVPASTGTWLVIDAWRRDRSDPRRFPAGRAAARPASGSESPSRPGSGARPRARLQHAGMAAVAAGQAQSLEQPRHALVEHGAVVTAGPVAEGAGQPGLPVPGRAHDILPRNSRSTSASTTRITRVLGNACWCCARSIMPALGILRSRCRAERMAFCPNG